MITDSFHCLVFCCLTLLLCAISVLSYLSRIIRGNDLDLHNTDLIIIPINLINLMMILTYSFTSAIFDQHFTNLLHIQHISALFTHLISVTWNFSVIILIGSWVGVLNRKLVRIIFTLFLICTWVLLIWIFHADYHTHPIGDNYIATGSHERLGIIYLLIYCFSMLFAKSFTILVCWDLYKSYQNIRYKTGLTLMILGSFIIIIFVFSRIYDIFLLENQIKKWEFVPLTLLVLGATIFSFGLNFPRLMYLVDFCKKLTFLIKILDCHLKLKSILLVAEDKLLFSSTENFSFFHWLSRTSLEKRIYVETIKIYDSLILSSGGIFPLALENKSNKIFTRFRKLYPSIYSFTIEETGIPNEIILNMLLYRKLKKNKNLDYYLKTYKINSTL